jgi:hypothetical protein
MPGASPNPILISLIAFTATVAIFVLLLYKCIFGYIVNFLIGLRAGLPDFSWYVIPKQEIITKSTQISSNGHKLSQMAVKYSKWP